MNVETIQDAADAPERYELENEPFPQHLPIRADLFQLYGNGLVILASPAPLDPARAAARDFDVWLHVGENGQAVVCAGKAEVGQNARTSLAQAVAEELQLSVDSVSVVLGDTDLTPFDMGTFGSRTTPLLVPTVRRAAAAARMCLIELAAKQPAGQGLDYGTLVRGLRLVRAVGPEIAVTPADERQRGEKSIPKKNGRDFVTGKHHFTSDLALPGMLHGKVLRPPAFPASLKSVNTSRASAMPGVIVVQEGSFVGVAAPTVAEATRALEAISAEWEVPPAPPGQDLVQLLRPEATPTPTPPADATHQHQATYTLAYIAHVPLEPRAALATWGDDGKLTVWTGTQRPFGVHEELVTAFGLPEEQVRVVVPDTGSGYGGKHTGEAALEAARLARAAGRPVKVIWTREEEFMCAYLRPAGVIDVYAATRDDGTLTAWEMHNYNSGAAGLRSPYAVSGTRTEEFHEAASPLRQGSYRALAATGNHFARESHMDDLAQAHGQDPLAFRLHHVTDARLRAVLQAAAERFGWNEREAIPGHGYGIAGGTEKGSFVANCVEVVIHPTEGRLEIRRIVAAFECGVILNPLHLQNQVEGATVMGVGGTLFEEIRFDGRRILNPRLSEYRVPRFSDIPDIEVVLLDRPDLPSVGAGETPIVAIAPALGNAIFDATGLRLRALPLAPGGQISVPK